MKKGTWPEPQSDTRPPTSCKRILSGARPRSILPQPAFQAGILPDRGEMGRSPPIILVDEVLLLIPKSPDPCRLVFLHHSLFTGAGLHVSGSEEEATSGSRLHALLAPLERVYVKPAGLPPAKGFQRRLGTVSSKEMLPLRPEL